MELLAVMKPVSCNTFEKKTGAVGDHIDYFVQTCLHHSTIKKKTQSEIILNIIYNS